MKTDDSELQEGVLVCSNEMCKSEFPVIDGIPVILANLRSYLGQNLLPFLCREDLSETMASLLGDCAGPGSGYDLMRQHISTYGFAHYGDFDQEGASNLSSAGAITSLFEKSMAHLQPKITGSFLDVGCSVGRTTFELAGQSDGLVLGVDLNFAMLKMARSVMNEGKATYFLRREGLVYERRSFPVSFEGGKRADFWLCDASALPFRSECFSGAASFNVLDCLWSPYDHLREMIRILQTGAKAAVSTPFDWSANVTPVEGWLGGHSQRAPHQGLGKFYISALLKSKPCAQELQQIEILCEEDVPWCLRLHDRSIMQYLTHLMILKKHSDTPDPQRDIMKQVEDEGEG
jgi:ubiquinone/menaquinone biosynthesis C-methylase UbiE